MALSLLLLKLLLCQDLQNLIWGSFGPFLDQITLQKPLNQTNQAKYKRKEEPLRTEMRIKERWVLTGEGGE